MLTEGEGEGEGSGPFVRVHLSIQFCPFWPIRGHTQLAVAQTPVAGSKALFDYYSTRGGRLIGTIRLLPPGSINRATLNEASQRVGEVSRYIKFR